MSISLEFLDTNILVRHLTRDVPDQADRARAFLARVEAGALRVRITDLVVFETVFTLQRTYRHPPAAIRDALRPLLELRGIVLPSKARILRALDLYADTSLPFADAYHAVFMKELKITTIHSFDSHFDRIPDLVRHEP